MLRLELPSAPGSEPPNAHAESIKLKPERKQSAANSSKPLILCRIVQCAVIGISKATVRAASGETGLGAQCNPCCGRYECLATFFMLKTCHTQNEFC